jgi:hypothetical protein
LVVGADFFPLTSRYDPNVLFWDVNTALENKKIPKGITHLWISAYIPQDRSSQLEEEALDRNIQVWRCSIAELCNRLHPFWKKAYNRTLNKRLEDVKEQNLQLIKDTWELITKTGGPVSQLASTRRERAAGSPKPKASARKRDAPEVPAPLPSATETASLPASVNWNEALAELPDIEREVFSKVRGVNGGKPQRHEVVAKDFGLPVGNLQKILARAERKLEAKGIALA